MVDRLFPVIDSFEGEYRFLSNFVAVGVPSGSWYIRWNGLYFRTVEHAYQAAKTLDPAEQWKIQKAATPGQAKRLGRDATKREDWDDIKILVMGCLLRQKFLVPQAAEMLLATGDAELIEGNTWGDTFWGVCDGVGENNLGKLLMNIRKEIRR
jgi:ribA/ribD-fused uncharacterized protein